MTSPVENISCKQCNNVFRPNMVKSKELKFQVHDVKRIASRYDYTEISLQLQPREAQYMLLFEHQNMQRRIQQRIPQES